MFIAISTPASNRPSSLQGVMPGLGNCKMRRHGVPVIVPCMTVPFLSSTCTVSLLSFIKNLQSNKDCHLACARAGLASAIDLVSGCLRHTYLTSLTMASQVDASSQLAKQNQSWRKRARLPSTAGSENGESSRKVSRCTRTQNG